MEKPSKKFYAAATFCLTGGLCFTTALQGAIDTKAQVASTVAHSWHSSNLVATDIDTSGVTACSGDACIDDFARRRNRAKTLINRFTKDKKVNRSKRSSRIEMRTTFVPDATERMDRKSARLEQKKERVKTRTKRTARKATFKRRGADLATEVVDGVRKKPSLTSRTRKNFVGQGVRRVAEKVDRQPRRLMKKMVSERKNSRRGYSAAPAEPAEAEASGSEE